VDVEENMFVAVQALKRSWIDHEAFVAACEDWATNKSDPIGGILVRQGCLSEDQRKTLEAAATFARGQQALKAELGKIADADVRDAMRLLNDRDIQQTMAGLAPTAGIRMDAPRAAVGTLRRYELTREYSEGGLSRIWLARDANLHRDVILKELHPDLCGSAEVRGRFLNEAQIKGQLEHPNNVPGYELGPRDDDQPPYYTMRFVRGRTFEKAIQDFHGKESKAGRVLEERELIGTFLGVCNAIAYAHSRGVLHRDLKPQNVVLGDFGEVILLDWGLAKVVGAEDEDRSGVEIPDSHDPQMTAAGSVLGTPSYLAPELAMGAAGDVDERTDVYGLGGILFELLTNRPPHTGANTGEVIRSVIANDSPRALDVDGTVPPALDAICARAMAKDPGERYSDAKALAADVRRWLADEPVGAYREKWTARIRRWSRHHRGATAIGTVLLVSLALALVNLGWQKSRAIDHEMESLGAQTREQSGRLGALIDTLRDDAKYLADHDDVRKILGSTDTDAPGTTASAKKDLQGVFLEFLRHRTNYLQARLLGPDGHELVRVERDGAAEGRARGDSLRPAEKLGDKSKSTYFTDAIKLSSGQVYLSAVELNREGGEVEVPDLPVIRAAVPVRLDEAVGSAPVMGVLVINVDFRPLFRMLQGTTRDGQAPHVVCVTNDAGWFLWNPDAPRHTYGFDRRAELQGQPGYRMQSVYPELAPFFGRPHGSSSVRIVSGEGAARRAVNVYRLSMDGGGHRSHLGLAIVAPYAEIEKRAKAAYEVPMYTSIALGIAFLALLIALLLHERRMARALKDEADPS
jgi:hypothetical protein